jgi:hypothetical protein
VTQREGVINIGWLHLVLISTIWLGYYVIISQQLIHPWKKLDYKKLGLFHFIDKVNLVAFLLDLPSHYQTQNVFHASLLKLYHLSPILGKRIM